MPHYAATPAPQPTPHVPAAPAYGALATGAFTGGNSFMSTYNPGRVGLLIEVSGSSIQPLDVGSKSCLLLRRQIGDRHLDRDFRRGAGLRALGSIGVWARKIAPLIEIMLIHGWSPAQPVRPQGEIDRLEYFEG